MPNEQKIFGTFGKFGRFGTFGILLDNIKFEHTIFALPFAYLGMVLAARGLPTWHQFVWITVAMVSARTLAMSLNRLIDRELDARNPRTMHRPLPRGAISARAVFAISFVSFALFEFAAWQLNELCFALSPLALIFLVGYHYTKRFTWLCHWILGFTDGIAAAGGWIAVRASFDVIPLVLWFAVTVWIAGFDLIYACQDVDVDRRDGLYSVPARFGIATALTLARVNHALTVLALALVGIIAQLGIAFWLGLVVVAILLAYENAIVKPNDLSRLNLAFFNVNGYISVIVFVSALLGIHF
ncbi:MAG: putative 4-hydroxybenzoate polyprenyltransferase [Anaerolineae bacterium]|nr:putative 4-hydroxybenzoate polyprenyltransferase [Anaerolineae bacterium]